MAKVKVWNKNVHPYKEVFKGTPIEIPAGGFVEMDYEEAVEFKGTFSPLPPEDCPEPSKYYKMIVVDAPKEPVYVADPLMNHADGTRAADAEALAAALKQFAHLQVKDETLDKAPKEDPRLAALEAQLKAQSEQIAALVAAQSAEKRGPGRPPKQKAGE